MSMYDVDETVLAYHGPSIYEAKVQRTQKSHAGDWQYFLHYQGWNRKYDEWVLATRIMKDNDRNRVLARETNEALKRKQKPAVTEKAAPQEKEEPAKKGKARKSTGGDAAAATELTASAAGAASSAASSSGAAVAGRKRKLDTKGPETEGPAEDNAMKLSIPFSLKKVLVEDWDLITNRRYLPVVPMPAAGEKVEGTGRKTLTAGEMCNAYLAHLKGEDWDLKPPKKVRNGGGKGGQDTGAGAGAASSSSSSSSSAAASSNPPPAKKGRGAGAGGSVSDKQYKAAKDVIEGLRVYFDRAFPVFLLYRFERPYFEAAYREHLRTKYTAASRTVYSEICSPEHFLRLFPKLPDLLAHANINKEEYDVLVVNVADFLKWMGKNARYLFSVEHYNKAQPDYCSTYDKHVASTVVTSGAARSVPRIPLAQCVSSGVTPTDGLHRDK